MTSSFSTKHCTNVDHDDDGGPALGVRRRGRPGSIARPKHGRPRDRAAVPSAGVSAHAGYDPSRKRRCALRAPRRHELTAINDIAFGRPANNPDGFRCCSRLLDIACCLWARHVRRAVSSELPGRIVADARQRPTPSGLVGASRAACGRGTQTVSDLFSSVSMRCPTRRRHRSPSCHPPRPRPAD